MFARTVSHSNLSSECWIVQIQGIQACESCELKDTEDCGGQDIILTGKNSKGIEVPVP